jgi:lipopolysaccharide transport system permease protein
MNSETSSPQTPGVGEVSGTAGGLKPQFNDTSEASTAVTIILPYRGWFDWRLKQLWPSRDLIGLFVWRDFVAVYKQTILGPTWHVIRPLLTAITFAVIFGRLAGLSTDGAPGFLFYMAGTVVWSYFATCLDNVSKTFIANANLLGKVYFHRLVLPVSVVISNLVSFGIQLAIFLLILIGYKLGTDAPVHFTAWVLALPVIVLLLAGYALAGGVIICALTTRYRDLTYLLTFGTQLLMYLTPVIYPVSAVPPQYRWLVRLNPLAPLLEAFRRGFLGVGTVAAGEIAVAAIVMLFVLCAGLMLFTHVERTFVDTM